MPGAKLQEGAGSCEDGSVDPVCVCAHSSCSAVFCCLPTLPKSLLIQQMLYEMCKLVSCVLEREKKKGGAGGGDARQLARAQRFHIEH